MMLRRDACLAQPRDLHLGPRQSLLCCAQSLDLQVHGLMQTIVCVQTQLKQGICALVRVKLWVCMYKYFCVQLMALYNLCNNAQGDVRRTAHQSVMSSPAEL